ncbi:IclR family transcriptional regulator (plasmid) [Arthrobacter sp. zg-Y820]|uniref:IclR family transcriptional regulator n=1 Tax=unclassified Arthrobacter TaxID=235627 RepID=UPI001E61490B|nr:MULTISPECIES: IclR family transcriptional regulator [unclassified Arthrobacter]MCC9198520.1 IclR family transcriptional regulator [Arthrobacter sp. zg-Y820]MDK1281390.1 IclR family transcriptional regulator [Arthrobacter sp. zg.Y820]WIB11263.1 IclR family transcriptional regulator [Arthrobacter sp. zg-Y820]
MTKQAEANADGARSKGPEGLRALDRAMSILFALTSHPDGISLADLSRETGLTTTTVHRMLAALRSKGLARETPSGLHGLGVGTLVLSGAYLAGLDLRTESRPHLERLSIETNETCHLGALASPQIVYIEKMDSTHPVRMVSRVGGTMPAVLTAIGRAILAYSSDEVVAKTLADTKFQLGDIVQEAALMEEIANARRLGYSLDLEENEPGICCVGAPVMDASGRPVAGISVSTPSERFDRSAVDSFGLLVRKTADDISESLGYLPPARLVQMKEAGKGGEDAQ